MFELPSFLWLYHDVCHPSKSESFPPECICNPKLWLCSALSASIILLLPLTDLLLRLMPEQFLWLEGKSFARMLNLQNRPRGKHLLFCWKTFPLSRLVDCLKSCADVKCLGRILSWWGNAREYTWGQRDDGLRDQQYHRASLVLHRMNSFPSSFCLLYSCHSRSSLRLILTQ